MGPHGTITTHDSYGYDKNDNDNIIMITTTAMRMTTMMIKIVMMTEADLRKGPEGTAPHLRQKNIRIAFGSG